jgi:hypothetical protein
VKRNLDDPETWREACRLMVEYACKGPYELTFWGVYEWLKREWNVNTIQGTQAHKTDLANVFYGARSGVRMSPTTKPK